MKCKNSHARQPKPSLSIPTECSGLMELGSKFRKYFPKVIFYCEFERLK